MSVTNILTHKICHILSESKEGKIKTKHQPMGVFEAITIGLLRDMSDISMAMVNIFIPHCSLINSPSVFPLYVVAFYAGALS